MKRILAVFSLFFFLVPVAMAEQYVSTFTPSGNLLNTFGAGLNEDEMVTFVDEGPTGDLWIGRMDTSHSTMQFNPDDMVIRFSPSGEQLQIVKGPMRYPKAIGFVSSGDMYIGAKPDGGALGDDFFYVFEPDGTYDFSFGSLNDNVEDIVVTADDRIFATTSNAGTLWEFDMAGNQINKFQIPGYYFGRDLALDTTVAGSRLWVYEPKNGAGNDRIVAYDLSFNEISQFELDHIDNPFLAGLEILPSGNLLAAGWDGIFYELEPDGTLADTFTFPEIPAIREFTLNGDNNIVVVHMNSLMPTALVPTTNTWGAALLVLLLASAAWVGHRKRQHPAV